MLLGGEVGVLQGVRLCAAQGVLEGMYYLGVFRLQDSQLTSSFLDSYSDNLEVVIPLPTNTCSI